MNRALIDIEQVQNFIKEHADRVIILDASIDKVGQKLDNNNLELIPNSHFFDIENAFSDKAINLPHTMVDSSTFENEARKLGINEDSIILLYDRWGVYSSPRAWWMFKYMGFDQVYVINGGLPAWKSADLPTVDSYAAVEPTGNFIAKPNSEWIIKIDELKELVGEADVHITDARSAGRFSGAAPEPRPGLKSGHIPGSKNIPFDQVLDGAYFRSNEQIAPLYADKSFSSGQNIFTCGSGITASILALGAYELGYPHIRVYDGSWSEWGSDPDTIVDQNI